LKAVVSYQIGEHCEVFWVGHEMLLDVDSIVAEILGRLDQVALPEASSGQDLHIQVLKKYSTFEKHDGTVDDSLASIRLLIEANILVRGRVDKAHRLVIAVLRTRRQDRGSSVGLQLDLGSRAHLGPL
jgi:hypothetical protein